MCKCDPSIRTPFCRRGDCFPPSEKSFKKGELAVVELEAYDAGFLSSYGEGNVQWWHDYMRAELERARAFYEQQVEQMLSGMAIVPVERTFEAGAKEQATCSVCGLKRSDTKNCKAPDCSPMLAAREKQS